MQEDAILVDYMGGLNHPDLALRAGEEALPESDDSDLEEIAPFRSIRRVDLPMIIQGSTVIARPDSGSEDNIIAVDVLSALQRVPCREWKIRLGTRPDRDQVRLCKGPYLGALLYILCFPKPHK